MPHGSVENERAFSALAWLKDDKGNRLRQDTLNVRMRLKLAASSMTGKLLGYDNVALLADAFRIWCACPNRGIDRLVEEK